MPDARKFLGGRWLRKKHINPNYDTVLLITGVVVDRYEADDDDDEADEQEDKLALQFEGTDKQLGLCDCNLEQTIELFGPDYDKWPGNRIALYVDPKVKFKGERVGGVRIRPKIPAATKTKARRRKSVNTEVQENGATKRRTTRRKSARN